MNSKSIYLVISEVIMYEIGFNPKVLPNHAYSHLRTYDLNEALEFYRKYRYLNNKYYILHCLNSPDFGPYPVVEIFTDVDLDKLLCLI